MMEDIRMRINELAFAKKGLASNMTVDQIAEKHGVSVEAIETQLEKGMKIELEHTSDLDEARDIALDHLVEFPDYYDRLEKMEKEAEEELKDATLVLNESEKVIKKEIDDIKKYLTGEEVKGIEENRFKRIWNTVEGDFKISTRIFIKMLNPLNWPKAIFFGLYDFLKDIANIGTKEKAGLKLDMHKFLVDVADGKYKNKKSKELMDSYNKIREKHGYKKLSFLESVRTDFNGIPNVDFDGNIIDDSLNEDLMLINENFFEKVKFGSIKMVINLMPNLAIDNILEDIIKKSNIKNIDLSKLKSLERTKKIELIKSLIDKAVEGSKNIDKNKILQLEKESKEIITKAKEKNNQEIIGTAASDTLKASGNVMRSSALMLLIAPIVSVIGFLPSVVIGTIIASGAHESLLKQFK